MATHHNGTGDAAGCLPDELLAHVVSFLPQRRVRLFGGGLELSSRGAVERVSRRWRRVALGVPKAGLEVDVWNVSQHSRVGRSAQLPPEQLAQVASNVAACLSGRRFLAVEFEWSESPLCGLLWPEVEPLLPAAHRLQCLDVGRQAIAALSASCPALEELSLRFGSGGSQELSEDLQALVSHLRPLSRLRRIELDMTDAPDGLAALADTLCTLPALDHATLTFVRSLPERPEVWRSLAQLGSKLRIGSRSAAAAVRLPDPPFIDTIVDGLDRLPCLRWLEYYQGDRSELVAVPRQLWSCQQLTWLSLCGVRFYAPHAPANAGSAWTALQHVELHGCDFDPDALEQRLPEAFCSLTRLTHLQVVSKPELCEALELPPAFSQLSRLQQLALVGARINNLEALCPLGGLTELHLPDQRSGSMPVGPYLTGLRALNIGDLLLGGSSAPPPDSWAWLREARRLQALAHSVPATAERLQQLWPGLESSLRQLLWLETLVVGVDGGAPAVAAALRQRFAASGLAADLRLLSGDALSQGMLPPPFELSLKCATHGSA